MRAPPIPSALHARLRAGTVIPALPLALDDAGRWDERHQRALVRYYVDAGVGGLAVGVHGTQFAIRDPAVGLYEPLLAFAAAHADAWAARAGRPLLRIAGVCGGTEQALAEAATARRLGYHAILPSLLALGDAPEEALAEHLARLAEVLPVIGFFLQEAVGGRRLGYGFWRRFAAIPDAVAVKIAPFDRYRTLDVVRAVADSGRAGDLALYTGNDDAIVADLLTPLPFGAGGAPLRIVGGLLGHWGVWTRPAVALHARIAELRGAGGPIPAGLLAVGARVTDMNGAVFDAANRFRGCIPGIQEVLRRQGLLASNRCLDPHERLSPGQAEELSRVAAAHPELVDDAFVRDNLPAWLADG